MTGEKLTPNEEKFIAIRQKIFDGITTALSEGNPAGALYLLREEIKHDREMNLRARDNPATKCPLYKQEVYDAFVAEVKKGLTKEETKKQEDLARQQGPTKGYDNAVLIEYEALLTFVERFKPDPSLIENPASTSENPPLRTVPGMYGGFGRK
jgi:hypothetical protein